MSTSLVPRGVRQALTWDSYSSLAKSKFTISSPWGGGYWLYVVMGFGCRKWVINNSTMINKEQITKHFDQNAFQRPSWFHRNRLYSNQIIEVCRPFINANSRILELGCSTGDLLNLLNPGFGVGVDISQRSITLAQEHYPHLTWICADAENLPETTPFDEPFDLIVMSDLVSYLSDIQQSLEDLHSISHSGTRIIISHWNWLWSPALRIAEYLNIKAPDLEARYNWISLSAITSFLELSGYEVVLVRPGLLFPYQLPLFSQLINTLSYAPLLDRATLLHTVVARVKPPSKLTKSPSVTVVIPTRNEVKNIQAAVERTPEMGEHTELLFIDGNSTDGTVEEIHRQIQAHPDRDIKFMPQISMTSSDSNTPPDLMLKLGKGDAVRKAFEQATGEILMILDSDLTVPPEELPRFYEALVTGKGSFANGTRLIYPQEEGAMPMLNKLGNVVFSLLFSWLLDQPVTDTLCGTKAISKEDYQKIAENRSYFGDFDPFGDFDLLFGAVRQGLQIVEIPVHYKSRTYGDSKVRVHMHGPLLLRMSLIAFIRFKLQPLVTLKGRLRLKRLSVSPSFLVGVFAFIVFIMMRFFRKEDRKP